MKLILIFLFMVALPSFAENDPILNCRVNNAEWSALFTLDSTGEGLLKFKKSDQPQEYTCALKLEYIGDGQRAISPMVTVELNIESCSPELGTLQTEILNRQRLIVSLLEKGKPKGRVQWLTSKQPDHCKVEKLKMFDIQLGAKKWSQGKWGRTTASQTPKANAPASSLPKRK